MARYVIPLAICILIWRCASGRAHENFKVIMQSEIGKSISNPYITRNVDRRNRLVKTTQLHNGNFEEEFKAGIGTTCRVFFEIDNELQKIVGWRYEGNEWDCVIIP